MSIKRIDPNATFKVVVEQDDALDNETAEEQEALVIRRDPDGKALESNKNRYERFVETLDINILKFKPDATPTLFVVRGLRHAELQAFNEKYVKFDEATRTQVVSKRGDMFIEMFELACLGIEENGKVVKVSADELEYGVVIGIGALIQIISVLNKNIKKA